MAYFFFDIDDGEHSTRDEEGVDLPDIRSARLEALRTMPGIAKDGLPRGDRRDFVARIRDESGGVVLTVTLALTVEWPQEVALPRGIGR